MPHRLNEFRSKIQFVAMAAMPSLIHRACLETGAYSNTAYIQRAVCEALARDLDMDLDALLDLLPPNVGSSATLFGGDRQRTRRPRSERAWERNRRKVTKV